MAPNSLFAILLRKPWWVSLGVGAALAAALGALLPERFAVPGMLASAPFWVIAVMAAWRQRGQLKPAQQLALLEQLRSLGAKEVAAVAEQAFRHQGHAVQRFAGAGADLELQRGGSVTLVSLRRWKAASTGVEPLRELQAACARHGDAAALYVAGGELGDKAREFARDAGIRLMALEEWLQLLHASGAAALTSKT